MGALRAANCEHALKARPVFDTSDPSLAACEMELCDVFEGRFWARCARPSACLSVCPSVYLPGGCRGAAGAIDEC